jgi:23S rRNA (pseudouridine1915-N3)-methyltransferase
MRLLVAAVGRLKQGPEREIAERYRTRAIKAGRAAGITDVEIVEVAESRAREAERRKVEESIALAQLIPDRAVAVLLDQRGDNLSTEELTASLREWRAEARPAAVFLIGGPDGVAPGIEEKAQMRISFGAATWPHQLVRVMLLEQIYRAMTVMAGHPYHRA